MAKKIKIALVFGGTSEERKVSLESGKTIADYLDKLKYDLIPVEISAQGKWLISSPTIKLIQSQNKTKHITSNQAIVPIDQNSVGKIDVAFLALHGPGGEDGTIQGMLESLRVKYTGSGILASALAMDKAKTKRFVASIGVNVAPQILLTKAEYRKSPKKYLSQIRGKVVIKPNGIGSSIGVAISADKSEIKKAIENAFKHDSQLIVEQFIVGRELTVPILGNQEPQALPVIEIVPKVSEFFDYRAKYEIGGSDEIVPARIPSSLAKKLQATARAIHKLIGGRGITRSDFIVSRSGQIYFLEINTIPGMTQNSLVPKAAAAAGISYPQLLDKLINLALEK